MRVFYALLLWSARTVEKPVFSFVKRAWSYFYRNQITTFIRIAIQWFVGCRQVEVIARHSVQSFSTFNPFFSDLDLSVILRDEDLHRAPKINRAYKWAKRFFIFLGEMEIYSVSERFQLKGLLQCYGRSYELLRDFRKVRWMELEYEKRSLPYHRQKCLRSIEMCFRKMGIEMTASPRDNYERTRQSWVPALTSALIGREISHEKLSKLPDQGVYAVYFQAYIQTVEGISGHEPRLSCSTGLAYWLLALSPQTAFGDDSTDIQIQKLRRENSEISNLWRALAKIEAIVFQAYRRGAPNEEEWMDGWLTALIGISKTEVALSSSRREKSFADGAKTLA